MKILIVEDEKKIVSFLKNGLHSEGYVVEAAFDGESGLAMAEAGKYDLLILDIMLPKMNGTTVCKKLRSVGKNMPIIMLTAKDSVANRVDGLDAGADDYLTKPYSFEELLARVRALTRRHKKPAEKILKLVDLSLDTQSFEVTRSNKKIELSATEFKLLQYLLETSPRVASKTMILEKIWGYHFSPESNIVDVYVKYLRDKIDLGFKKKLIQTVRGIGYKICA